MSIRGSNLKAEAPYHPIIYVRGYAMTGQEIDDTTADPFCGFNIGSTVYRSTSQRKKAKKFVFESPVIRLATDFEYTDVFNDGLDILDEGWDEPIPYRSVIIFRYYEQASGLLGSGETPSIETFATQLGKLILKVQKLTSKYPGNALKKADFRCYLVAHSMGGLVCRALLQNPALDPGGAAACVDKYFTYATPHNGIEVVGVNIPSWLKTFDIDNFNHKRMQDYLAIDKALYKKTGRVDWLPQAAFPSDKVFCMVGTNRADYEVAMGMSRTFAGQGSDGLVRIENASVWGIDAAGTVTPCATAYAYRAHSGYFGIVNNEESYQNLTRFLFGNIRVDVWAEIEAVSLPPELQGEKKVNAVYQFEVLASPKGVPWYLTRRTPEEDSVACRTHEELGAALAAPKPGGAQQIYLSSVFLGNHWAVNQDKRELSYSMNLGVRVPDYELGKKLWFDSHYEGAYLFNDTVVIRLTRPEQPGEPWIVGYDWLLDDVGEVPRPVDPKTMQDHKVVLEVGFESRRQAPAIRGKLRFLISAWNG